jgi:hypothetical protein
VADYHIRYKTDDYNGGDVEWDDATKIWTGYFREGAKWVKENTLPSSAERVILEQFGIPAARAACVDVVHTGPEELRRLASELARPVEFDPDWRTSTAVALAREMYQSRDFGAMPILADALQDAGCDSADILDHCRGPGPHVRGCWVIDLVLGKA